MAPQEPTSDASSNQELSLRDIIFSCGVCQATINEVYATKESDRGFNRGDDGDDGIVAKLWITECSHITCAKHLPGGAPPFHPRDEPPKAACPQCLQEGGNGDLKYLYAIRGLLHGEYDPTIPAAWLDCPPVRLDAKAEGMEALRFQYLNLARYGQKVHEHWKAALAKQKTMEQACKEERNTRRRLQNEVQHLRSRNAGLEKDQAQLQRWEERKPMINHYLGVVSDMAKDIETLRNKLTDLGYDVPERKYTFEAAQGGDQQNADSRKNSDRDMTRDSRHGRLRQDIAPRNKKSASSDTLVNADEGYSSSSRKRKHAEYAGDMTGERLDRIEQPRSDDRQLMPPPLPKPRQRTVPPVDWSTTLQQRPIEPVKAQSSHNAVQIYGDGNWAPLRVTRNTEEPGQAYSRAGCVLNAASLLFRPSPVYQAQLSASHNVDPRFQEPMYDSQARQEHYQPLPQTQRQPQFEYTHPHEGKISSSYEDRRTISHGPRVSTFNEGYGTVAMQLEDQQREPLQIFTQPQLDNGREDEFSYSARRDPRMNDSDVSIQHRMPSAQNAREMTASVSSPFFKRGPTFSRAVTHQHQSTANDSRLQYSDAHQRLSQDHRMVPVRRDRGQPLSVNGLSFIEQPHRSTDNQPLYRQLSIAPQHETQLAVPQTPRNSQGLFQRFNGPPLPASYAPVRSQSSIPRSRFTLLPSTQSLVPVTNGAIARRQDADEALSQVRSIRGVSSRHGMFSRNMYSAGPSYGASRTLFSSAGGRRSVRR